VSARGDPAAEGRVIRVLTGCTAAGKTEWAIRWAEANAAEIISCDSLLFYRGMDIGTAKPTREELSRVPHHLIDIRDVSEPMNVALYCAMALKAAQEIVSRGRAVLVVGGSGFYLKSYFAPVADSVAVPGDVRAAVASLMRDGGLAGLIGELARRNPEGIAGVDPANPRRGAAALERCLASGKTLAELASSFGRAPCAFAGWDVRLARIDLPAARLEERISARVDAMLGAGLVDEVRRLAAAGLRSNPSAARAIGYRETLDALEGRLEIGSLAAAIAKDTRALVKKQRTWFRTQLPGHEVHDASDPSGAARLFAGSGAAP
jgi:tRNA dimethylallyltransferase